MSSLVSNKEDSSVIDKDEMHAKMSIDDAKCPR